MSTCTKCGNIFIGSEELSTNKSTVAICDDCFREGMKPQDPEPAAESITMPAAKPRPTAASIPIKLAQTITAQSDPTVKYQPELIYQYASHLYSRSMVTARIYTMIAIFGGGIIGGVLGYASFKFTEVRMLGAVLGFIIGAILLGLLGYDFGMERASAIRMKAQLALCQVAMEENTRRKEKK